MEPLPLFKNQKERIYLSLFLLILFSFNLFLNYSQYQKFIHNEVFHTQGEIINIYEKEKYNILKISTNNFTFSPLQTKVVFMRNCKKLIFI